MKKFKVAITILAMILLSGFTAGQLNAEERTTLDVQEELFEARKYVSDIERKNNLDTEAMRKVKALEKEYEELKAKEDAKAKESAVKGYSEKYAELYDIEEEAHEAFLKKNSELKNLLSKIDIYRDFKKDVTEMESRAEELKVEVETLKTKYEVAKAESLEQRRMEMKSKADFARAENVIKEAKKLGWRYNQVLELVGVNSSFFQTDVNTVGLFSAHGNILVLN